MSPSGEEIVAKVVPPVYQPWICVHSLRIRRRRGAQVAECRQDAAYVVEHTCLVGWLESKCGPIRAECAIVLPSRFLGCPEIVLEIRVRRRSCNCSAVSGNGLTQAPRGLRQQQRRAVTQTRAVAVAVLLCVHDSSGQGPAR